jgi:hypothetical protein
MAGGALVAEDGPLAGQRFEVDGELTFGREGTDVILDDSEVSRRHAVVRRSGDELEIEDLGSLNGTYLNERKVEKAALSGGDVVRIGTSTFAYEAAEALPGRAPPTRVAAPAAPPEPAPPQEAAPAQPSSPAAGPLSAPEAPAAAPSQPFGSLAVSAVSSRAIATRQPVATILSVAAVVATAIALILYFALR